MSYENAVADFLRAMEVEGVRPAEPIAQRLSGGELIRFRSEGDGQGRRNAWAILYLDERPAGAFGNYRLGLSRKWKAGDSHTLSPQERDRLQREWAAAKERRERERQDSMREAALDAAEMWAKARPADPGHAYLAKKGIDGAGLRQDGANILVPMIDADGELQNLQRIAPDGSKRFLKGGRTDGLFCLIGQPQGTLCIGEGYATLHAVHRASSHACVAAFSAKNLAAVARIWAHLRPDLEIIICADDDSHLERNVGLEAAVAAAAEVGARIAVPTRKAA